MTRKIANENDAAMNLFIHNHVMHVMLMRYDQPCLALCSVAKYIFISLSLYLLFDANKNRQAIKLPQCMVVIREPLNTVNHRWQNPSYRIVERLKQLEHTSLYQSLNLIDKSDASLEKVKDVDEIKCNITEAEDESPKPSAHKRRSPSCSHSLINQNIAKRPYGYETPPPAADWDLYFQLSKCDLNLAGKIAIIPDTNVFISHMIYIEKMVHQSKLLCICMH